MNDLVIERKFSFIINGIPKPAGSKTAYRNRYTGRVAVVDACRKSGEWKKSVAYQVINRWKENPYDGPIILEVSFYMPRPRNHYRKNGTLKENVNRYCDIRPDLTKLMRCLEDALTGIIWRDDSLIVRQTAEKKWADSGPGAHVEITLCRHSPV